MYCDVMYCWVMYCYVMYCCVMYCYVMYWCVMCCCVTYCYVMYWCVMCCCVTYCYVMYCCVMYSQASQFYLSVTRKIASQLPLIRWKSMNKCPAMPHPHGLREAGPMPQWNPWLESSEHSYEPNMQVLHAKCYYVLLLLHGHGYRSKLLKAMASTCFISASLHFCISALSNLDWYFDYFAALYTSFRMLQGLCWRHFPSVELLSRNATDQTSPDLQK